MKKIIYMVCTVIAIAMVVSSCKKKTEKPETKNYTCATCVTTPEAIAANDASSKGIYKGVIIGSTGTIKFDIANNGTEIKAIMVLDGATFTLTSNVTWTNDQAYIAPFTGTINGSNATVNLSVSADGQDVTITSADIPGHANASFTVVKETSTALIECFEGKYSTTASKTDPAEQGTFNILLCRSLKIWGGSHRKDGDSNSVGMDGTIAADGGLLENGTDYLATLTGDTISGSFKNSDVTITVTGKRTL